MFPSPADPYIDKKIDLHTYLISHPEATFFVRMTGCSMAGAGILPGDLLVVDRSLTPKNRDVVVAVVADEFLVRKFLEITEEVLVWGVVTGVVRKF